MKKNFIYALMSAIAFVGAAGFTACSSSEDVIDNPNYDPETNMVKTQFAISLGDNIVKTRMSSDNTQAAGTSEKFRGIQDILLIPFKSTSPTDANLNGKVIALSEDGTNGPSQTNVQDNDKNYLYNNVDVKTGTDYFTFYAVAKPSSLNRIKRGSLNPTLPLGNASSVIMNNYKFELVPIMTSDEFSGKQTQANNVRDNLVAKLNQVLAAEGWKGSQLPALMQLYAQFKSLRVGSSDGVQKALQNLYTSASTITTGDAATVAGKIKEAITGDLGESAKGENVTITESGGTLTFGADYNDYPTSIGLPNGSARLKFTDGGEGVDVFSAIDTEILWNSENATAPEKFVYPADLRYFVQTGIKTAESEFLKDNLASPWSTIIGNNAYNGTSVSGTTRSIVLTNPVQYGVGRLETNIAAMSEETYYDRKGAAVTIPTGGFTLTGVVIGGQKNVNWQFKPNGTTAYTIYDSDVDGVKASTTASAANHTLVLETTADEEVQVALQFTNNSTASFEGADGIIYPNQTFYLLAKLNPKTTGGNGTQPSETASINQVFLQDYVTKIELTINHGTNTEGNSAGFGAAVSGLPDLTTSKLEFGLSVNLSWESGLTFNVNI